jgi:hypothetical protein
MANKLTIAKGKGAIPNIGYQFDGDFRKGTAPTLLDSRQAQRVKAFIENLVFRSMFDITTGSPAANSFQIDFSGDRAIWFKMALQTALRFDEVPTLGGNLRLNGLNLLATRPASKFVQYAKEGLAIHPQGWPSDTVDDYGANLRLFGWDSGTPYNVGFRCPPATDLAGSGSLDADNGLVWVLPYEDGSSGQVLQTDGSRVLSWADGGGGGGMTSWTVEDTDANSEDITNGLILKFLGDTFLASEQTGDSADPEITYSLTATGTASATTFLRGDNTWAVPSGGGGGMTSFTVASLRYTNPFESPTTSSWVMSDGDEIEFWSYDKSILCSAATDQKMNLQIPYGEFDYDGDTWGHNGFVFSCVDSGGVIAANHAQLLSIAKLNNLDDYDDWGASIIFDANHNEAYPGYEDGWRFLKFKTDSGGVPSTTHGGVEIQIGRQLCTNIDSSYNGDPLSTGDASATASTLVYDGGTITNWYGDIPIGGEEGNEGAAGTFSLEAGPGIHMVVNIFGTTTYNIGLLHYIDEDDTGTYGSATAAAVVTVNKEGIITDISEVPISGGGGSGTVTSIATGNGLSGGTITTSGTLIIDETVAQTVSISADGGTASGDLTVDVGNAADNTVELVAGDGVTLTGDDAAGTIKIEGGSLTVEEVDGSPSVSSVETIVVSNGTLTDDGGGQVTVTTGGGIPNIDGGSPASVFLVDQNADGGTPSSTY